MCIAREPGNCLVNRMSIDSTKNTFTWTIRASVLVLYFYPSGSVHRTCIGSLGLILWSLVSAPDVYRIFGPSPSVYRACIGFLGLYPLESFCWCQKYWPLSCLPDVTLQQANTPIGSKSRWFCQIGTILARFLLLQQFSTNVSAISFLGTQWNNEEISICILRFL